MTAPTTTTARPRTFGPASELPYRRRTSDWVRLTVASVVLAGAIAHEGDDTALERSVVETFGDLPDAVHELADVVYRVGALWAVGLVAAAALIARRWRLARDLAVAGTAAWVAARVLGALVVDDADLAGAVGDAFAVGDATPQFPVTRLAVVVAVIAAAGPYLTRMTRRIGWLIVVLVALASLTLGLGVPNDALAAVVVGWGVAAAVHLVFGSPGGRPTRAQVRAALDELGVAARDVELAERQPRSGTVMSARDDTGPLELRVLGRDERDAQFLAKWWRVVLYRDGGPHLHVTRLGEIEHEAYALLAAERAGVRCPTVVVAGAAGPGAALLAVRAPAGRRLADVDPAACTDDVVTETWRQLATLHAAGVTHGRCSAAHVVLTGDGPAFTDFDRATTAAGAPAQAADVAELLAGTAAIAGDDRAVGAAIAAMGPDAVRAALPLLQPAAVGSDPWTVRPSARKATRERLASLRETAAAALGVDVPELQQLYRFKSANVMMAVGTLVAVFALLGQVGDPEEFWNTIRDGDFALLAVAFALAMSTNVAYAVAMLGAAPVRLGMWRASEVQNATIFANLAVPAVGGMAVQTRYLQKQGVPLPTAAATYGLLLVSGIAVQSVIFLVALVLSPASPDLGDIPTEEIAVVVAIAVLVVALVVGLLFGVPRLKAHVLPKIRDALHSIAEVFRSPRRFALLVVGQALNALIFGVDLMLCVEAFGGSVDYFTALAVNIGVSAIASLVPVPGGPTAVGSVGLSGALVAVGVPTEVAVAAVLANQLVNNFVPAVPGWLATRDLLAADYL